jgi:apolipoprotein N-acyltransferase
VRKIPRHLYLLAIFSAILQLIPFPIAGPVPLWRRLFCWICLVPLLLALSSKQRDDSPLRILQSAWISYLCGIAWYLGSCYWIYPTMHVYGNLPEAASLGIVLLFSLYLGLYFALFGALFAAVRIRWGAAISLLCAPLLWVSVELARGRITGFPWDLLGYTQVDNLVLTRIAPWTGVFGLSLLVAAVNALWAVCLQRLSRPNRDVLFVAAAIVTGALLWTEFGVRPRPFETAAASAVLLQENLTVGAETPRRFESKAAMLSSFAELSLHPDFPATQRSPAPTQLIAWPESPSDLFDADPAYRKFMSNLARSSSAAILADDLGVGGQKPDGTYILYNSATFFQPDGNYGGRYNKIHLVPFGEYVPYKPLFFFAGHLLDGLPFIPGTQRVVFNDQGRRYGVFICYESIFGDEVRQFVEGGAEVLVNLSDDGWYGDTSAPWEHLDMVRMRAIENHRWLLRATNTGVTASIDPEGRIVDQMPRHIRGALRARFGFLSDETFYTRHGDWIAWICVLCTAALLALDPMGLRIAPATK